MADQRLSEQAREAILAAIMKAAPTLGNSPAGIRDLAEAFAMLERGLTPNASVFVTPPDPSTPAPLLVKANLWPERPTKSNA